MQITTPPGAPADAGPDRDLIKESSTATFMADVIQTSLQTPVLVDFWAPWCGPCRQLTPLLEKAVREAGGKVKLVKINVDENPELAQQLRIQSIPAVYAFKNGQPVDGFMGALPESQIKSFIQSLTGDTGPTPVDQLLEQARSIYETGNLAAAAQAFGEVLQHEANHPKALAGLARCYMDDGDAGRAEQMLELVPPEHREDPDVVSARAALDLARQPRADSAEITTLRERIDADPDDHQARYDLALALNSAGEREGAVEALLEIIRRDRTWNDEAARKQLLKLFEAYGPADPVTAAGRRKLSSILFA
ncbi:MAG: thioredoxin [Alphaproteobacteria bacterium]